MNKVHWIRYEKRLFLQPEFLKARIALGNECFAAFFTIIDAILNSPNYTARLEDCINEAWYTKVNEEVVVRLIKEFKLFDFDANTNTVKSKIVDQSVQDFEKKSEINRQNALKRYKKAKEPVEKPVKQKKQIKILLMPIPPIAD